MSTPVRILLFAMLALLPVGRAHAATDATDPPSAVEITELLSRCPEFSSDRWPTVDELHERLILDLRALGPDAATLDRQRTLETRFFDDLSAAVGLAPECVQRMRLARDEARLRAALRAMRLASSAPSIDEVVQRPEWMAGAEASAARAATIRALESLLARVERARSTGASAESSSVLDPSPEERAAIRTCSALIDSLGVEADDVQRAAMRERLARAAAREPVDLPMRRAKVVLQHIAAVDPARKECIDAWLRAQRTKRAAAVRQFLDLLMKGAATPSELMPLLRAGTRNPDGENELFACLPAESNDAFLALIQHWDALDDPLEIARTTLGEDAARALARVSPPEVVSQPRYEVDIRVPEAGAPWLAPLAEGLLARPTTPDERDRVAASLAQWEASTRPVLIKLREAARRGDIGHADSPATQEAELAQAQAQRALIAGIFDAAARLQLELPAGIDPAAAVAITRFEWLAAALAEVPLAHDAAFGMQYPRIVGQSALIMHSGLSSAGMRSLLARLAVRAPRLVDRLQVLVTTVVDARIAGFERSAEQRSRADAPLRVHRAWDAWLAECAELQQALRGDGTQSSADPIEVSWMIAAYPALRNLVDLRIVLEPQSGHADVLLQRSLRSSLRDLAAVAFAARSDADGRLATATPGRIDTLLRRMRFDAENAVERKRRAPPG